MLQMQLWGDSVFAVVWEISFYKGGECGELGYLSSLSPGRASTF